VGTDADWGKGDGCAELRCETGMGEDWGTDWIECEWEVTWVSGWAMAMTGDAGGVGGVQGSSVCPWR
jgi:hypothetical protein